MHIALSFFDYLRKQQNLAWIFLLAGWPRILFGDSVTYIFLARAI